MRLSPARISFVWATFVAGPLSIAFLSAPAAAQQGGLPPGGARPPVGGPPAAAAQAAPAVAGTSVAVIDVAYIFENHVRFNAQMNDMKRDIEAFDATMREESQKLQKKAEEMATFGPTSPQFKKLDEDLAHLKSDFQIRVQAKKREFLEQEARVYYGIYREVEDAVVNFSQRNRIGLVLRYTSDEMKPEDRNSVLQGVNKPVVYQQNLDITSHILNQLNAGATMPPASPGSQIQPGTQNARPPANGPIIPQGTPGRPVTGPR